MVRPVERIFVIDEMIRSGDYPSLLMFMQRFEISERAVHGDLRYLKNRFHAPIAYSKKHGGYYYVLRDWSIATQAISPLPETEDDTWLWNEIAHRFGTQVATDLHRDFLEHKHGKPVRLCKWCEQPLPSDAHRYRLYHPDCKQSRLRDLQNKAHRRAYQKAKQERG